MSRSKSSKQWLHDHFADPYVQRAQKEGYRCRAVYKLLEIQKKDNILKPGMTIVDLGAAPGGWSQVAAKLLNGHGRVIAMDILPMQPLGGVNVIQGDFTTDEALAELLTQVAGKPVDVVLSDMAPNLSGMKAVDQPRSMYLAELALDFALRVLKPEGDFLVKLFQGEGFSEYLQNLRQHFKVIKTRKPHASRDCSREVYVLARKHKMSSPS